MTDCPVKKKRNIISNETDKIQPLIVSMTRFQDEKETALSNIFDAPRFLLS
jgi:hypothetical protein